MTNKFTFEDDLLWEKAATLTKCLHSINESLISINDIALRNKILLTAKTINAKILEGIQSDLASTQELCYSSAISLSRDLDSTLQAFFDSTPQNIDKIDQQQLFASFLLADQLREMLFNCKKDLNILKAS